MELNLANLRLKEVSTDDRGRVTLSSDYANQTLNVAIPFPLQPINELQPYHVRHDFSGVSQQGRMDLWAEHRTGIHWANRPYVGQWFFEKIEAEDPNRKRGPVDDINALRELAQNGGLVTVHDKQVPDAEDVMRIGRVPPGSEIEARRYDPEDPNGHAEFLKTVKMANVVEVTKDDYPELFELCPPRGSVRRWQKNKDVPRKIARDLLG